MSDKYTIRRLGPIMYQTDWDLKGWYYINRKNEKVQMAFFVGTVQAPEGDVTLKQIVVGPFMLTWAWP